MKHCFYRENGLENPMDYIVHEVTKSWMSLSDFHFHLHFHFGIFIPFFFTADIMQIKITI